MLVSPSAAAVTAAKNLSSASRDVMRRPPHSRVSSLMPRIPRLRQRQTVLMSGLAGAVFAASVIVSICSVSGSIIGHLRRVARSCAISPRITVATFVASLWLLLLLVYLLNPCDGGTSGR